MTDWPIFHNLFSKYGDYCDYFCAYIYTKLNRKYVNEESAIVNWADNIFFFFLMF